MPPVILTLSHGDARAGLSGMWSLSTTAAKPYGGSVAIGLQITSRYGSIDHGAPQALAARRFFYSRPSEFKRRPGSAAVALRPAGAKLLLDGLRQEAEVRHAAAAYDSRPMVAAGPFVDPHPRRLGAHIRLRQRIVAGDVYAADGVVGPRQDI